MSNENNTTNSPRKRLVRNSVSRSRRFSCITYLTELQLKACILRHINQIRYYAYAYHDKDVREDGTLKIPHFHIILVTYNTCTLSAIRRWFSGYTDINGDINTTSQICSDVYTMYDYLTHTTKEAIDSGKFVYDKSIVKTNDTDGFFRANEESEYDSITLALENLIKGTDIHTLCKRYGRDFILHYNAIKQVYSDITRCDKYNMTLDDILQEEFENNLLEMNR